MRKQGVIAKGQKADEQNPEYGIQKLLYSVLVTAKIKKPETLHWLRHSFATH
jgi:integrase/recombinase XerD